MQFLVTLTSAMKNYLQLCQVEPTGEILLSTLISAVAEGKKKKKKEIPSLAFIFYQNYFYDKMELRLFYYNVTIWQAVMSSSFHPLTNSNLMLLQQISNSSSLSLWYSTICFAVSSISMDCN